MTVFAGTPRAKTVQTTYDKLCGFSTAAEAMTARREEDKAAAAQLGAKPVHLGFIDSQYGKPTDQAGIVTYLQQLIEEYDPEFIVGPMGLYHPDHELVREAVLDTITASEIPLWLYKDIPNRVWYPECVQKALSAIRERGMTAELGFCGTGPLASCFRRVVR